VFEPVESAEASSSVPQAQLQRFIWNVHEGALPVSIFEVVDADAVCRWVSGRRYASTSQFEGEAEWSEAQICLQVSALTNDAWLRRLADRRRSSTRCRDRRRLAVEVIAHRLLAAMGVATSTGPARR